MKKLATVLGILVLAGAVAVPVFAWGPHGGWMGRGGGPGYCWGYGGGGYASLTPAQRTELDKLSQKFYNDTAALRNELWAKRAQLNTLLNTSNPDPEKVRTLQREISDLQAKLQQQRVEFQLQARRIAPQAPYGGGHGWGMGYGHGPGACWY